MKDIQKSEPAFKLPVYRVGIQNLKIPVHLRQKENSSVQHTVADVDCFVDLSDSMKGTHMSRLAIGIQKFMSQQLSSQQMIDIAEYIRNKCEAETCEIIYRFPYFLIKNAPESKEPGIVHYNTIFRMIKKENDYTFSFNIEVMATSLCPCSKEISESGAHNQRSRISITCVPKKETWVWIEDIINIAESSASCSMYSVLKRSDEKHVTDFAYDNPKFVEDMVREIYHKLSCVETLECFDVQVSNEESIHLHNAYARMYSGEEVHKHI